MSRTPTRPAVAGKANNPAGQQSKSSSAKHTKKSQKAAVAFVLPIDDKFRLTADERCWRIEQRRKDGEWRPIEYHTTLAPAVHSLSGRLLRTADVQCLADALVEVENIARTLTRALAPSFKVEKVSASRGSR
jgi:hypothetical protein